VFKESFLGEGYVLVEILKNAIKCNHCGDIIESTHRHNFV